MRKVVLLLSAAGLLMAAPAFATINGGVDLSWGTCGTQAQVSNIAFDCASAVTGSDDLFGTFKVTTRQDSFVAMDFALIVSFKGGAIPQYWEYNAAGCNDAVNGTLLLSAFPRPGTLCAGTTALGPWNPATLQGIAWVPGVGGTGKFVASIFRPSTQPFNLLANTNYFGFKITFFHFLAAEGGGPCQGCTTPGCIVWNSASFGNIRTVDDQAVHPGQRLGPYDVDGPDKTTNAVSFWGGGQQCPFTPTKNSTWGQIKSLYR